MNKLTVTGDLSFLKRGSEHFPLFVPKRYTSFGLVPKRSTYLAVCMNVSDRFKTRSEILMER